MMKIRLFVVFCLIFFSMLSFSVLQQLQDSSINLGYGDPETLEKVYQNWQIKHAAEHGIEKLRIRMVYSKFLSTRDVGANGWLDLNLLNGKIFGNFKGLEAYKNYTVWLIDSPSNTFTPQNNDKVINIGEFSADFSGSAVFMNQLRRDPKFLDFGFDWVVLTESNNTPNENRVLAGSPSFLQRYFYSNQMWSLAKFEQETTLNKEPEFAFLLPKSAFASKASGVTLEQLIAKGRDLFVNQTFNGNGRTCASCHRPDNNHTLDPSYIAKLPKTDPLFIHETNPQLANLENSKLLRQFGLVLTNVDGFDKPAIFRSPPHLLGLATSMQPEDVDMKISGTGQKNHMLGWSGDGSPGDGSLRMFAQGAIAQHFPKTLERINGIDFRLATSEELDALEAYMLSLGRSEELVLTKMKFNSPLAEQGKVLFDNKLDEGTAKCKGCHLNAGANSSTTLANGIRDTGVENLDLSPARVVEPSIAFDGGSGLQARNNCGASRQEKCYGDGQFNLTSLVEAADTPPYFHNNSAATLEEAIASYNSVAFNESPGSFSSGVPRKINIDSSKVTAVAAFLRAINVLENIRSSSKLDLRAINERGANYKETLSLAMADTEDAIQVLSQTSYNLYPEALQLLQESLIMEKKASMGFRQYLKQAENKKFLARELIVTQQ
jgi:cytochrome c peroxidase